MSPLTIVSDVSPSDSVAYSPKSGLPPRPTSPKRVFFTDVPKRPLSLNIRPSWGSESEVSSVSSSSAYSANLSPLSDGSHRKFPILKPKPRISIRKWMKRQMYGVDPEERWQEQIEDYCAIHYPDPLLSEWKSKSGSPRYRRDVAPVAASARWRRGSGT